MNQSTRLIIARHGETEGNQAGLHQGRTDSPLTATGLAQAKGLGRQLQSQQLDAVALYASPLGRAQTTAAAVGIRLGLPTVTDPDLVEGSFGEWEGYSRERFQRLGFWERARVDPDHGAPGGETFRECGHRAASAFRRLAVAHEGQTVVVVTHQGPICQGLAILLARPLPGFAYGLANGGYCEVTLGDQPSLDGQWRRRPVDL